MSGALGVLIWLICIGISAILIGYFLRELQKPEKKEGFTMLVCPAGSVSYITRNGDTQCCNGDVVDGWCSGNDICTLSPRSNNNLPTCGDYLASNLKQAGINLCPTTIPNYFASLDGSLRGCSVSQPLPNGIGPSDPNQLQCILYPTDNLDKVRLDSCYNYGLQVAKNAQLAQCTPSTNLQSPQAKEAQQVLEAPANSRGYILYGGDISGELAVTKIFDGFGPGDKTPSFKVYCTQDGQFIKYVVVDTAYTKINNARYFIGKLSDINDFSSFHKTSGKVGTTQSNYNIKKSDGSGILLSS
jgi:hypothetical protein